ncbi:MAG: signal transduction histidine kinase/ActR/RegA family two-component response regulator [Planctomycetota bacterium]|jgi:signal transduction histidine kinase/ActR/RegA family two-component response regulator
MLQATRLALLVLGFFAALLSPAFGAHATQAVVAPTETAADFYYRAVELPEHAFEERIELCRQGLALITAQSDPGLQLALYVLLGDTLLEHERFEESVEYHELAATLARDTNEGGALTIALYNLAYAATNLGNFERAINASREAADLAGSLDFPDIQIQVLNILGVSYDRMGDHEGAIRAYSEALELVANSGKTTVSYQLLSNLSVLNMNAGNLEEALEFFKRGLVIADEAQDLVAVATTLANIGDVHFLAGRYELALERHQQALKLREQMDREVDFALSLSRLGDVYIELGELDIAIDHLERAREIQERLGQKPEVVATLGRLSRAYSALDRDVDAIEAAKASNDLAQAIQTKALRVIALKDLAAAYESNGQLAEALETERKAFRLNHEVNSLVSTRAIAELNANVEHRMSEIIKNGEIIELERVAALSKAEIERQDMLRKFLIAGGVLLLMIALVGWSSYLFKRRANEALRASHYTTKRLLEAQKLESLGLLSGGVAHDFNNFLAVISGNSELARLASKDDDRISAHLDDIQIACRRATEVAQQMLCYAGKDAPLKEFVDFSAIACDTVALLRTTTPKNIRLTVEAEPGLPKVFGDKTQLGQVVMNLITNAVEAIGADPGEIETRVSSFEVRAGAIDGNDLKEGVYVKLEVSDTGIGIEQDRLAKLFDPFYTGKEAGHGLGLATVQGIARRHGGSIVVRSTPGEGTLFTVLLSTSEPASMELLDQPAPQLSTAKLKLGTALIIDDDEEVLKTTGRMLAVLHWENILVSEAQSGIDVVNDETPFDLLILDLVMPNTDITQTLTTIKGMRPDLPVLLISGFDRHGLVDQLTKMPLVSFLAKPFGIQQLSNCLQQMSTNLESDPVTSGNLQV